MAINRHTAPAAAGVPEIKSLEKRAAGAPLRIINCCLPEIRGANIFEQRRLKPGQLSRAGESRFINGGRDRLIRGVLVAYFACVLSQ